LVEFSEMWVKWRIASGWWIFNLWISLSYVPADRPLVSGYKESCRF
jgi:hypothetical protein